VRIARDLHDSVAHSLASISVQAGVGAHVIAAARALFRRAVDAGLINTNPAAALRKTRRSRSRRRARVPHRQARHPGSSSAVVSWTTCR
jgi:signal transduction histidine kinase